MEETDFKEAAVHHQVIILNTLHFFFNLVRNRNKMKYFAHGLHIFFKKSVLLLLLLQKHSGLVALITLNSFINIYTAKNIVHNSCGTK
jgi:hypothetical protein